ncbi:MAG TPA: hypothetical protein VI230_03890, partial [Ignavibacteriaceae bacterium]
MLKENKIIILLIAVFFIAGCDKKDDTNISKPLFVIQKNDSIPPFDGANAYAQVKAQVEFGPRNPGSAGHSLALTYLQNELNKYADEVKLQQFTYPGYNEQLNLTNIVARFNPENKKRIMICAH